MGVNMVKTLKNKGTTAMTPDKFRATMRYLRSAGRIEVVKSGYIPGKECKTYRIVQPAVMTLS